MCEKKKKTPSEKALEVLQTATELTKKYKKEGRAAVRELKDSILKEKNSQVA